MKRLYLIPMVYLEEHGHLAPKYLAYRGGTMQAAHAGLEGVGRKWSRAVYRPEEINLVVVDTNDAEHAVLSALPDVVYIPALADRPTPAERDKLANLTAKVAGRRVTGNPTYRDFLGNLSIPGRIWDKDL